MEMNHIIQIAKEQIPSLRFPAQDVLHHPEAIAQRQQQLQEASFRGNTMKDKVRLVLQTIDGPREVETTVWNAGQEHVSLKYGMMVPVRAIMDVRA